jgi:glucose-6-phosphate 1-dehydrogenase
MVIFGASGDLTKRLLMPSLYNLTCDGLLSERTAILGVALEELSDEAFRERLTGTMAQFNTRKSLDEKLWSGLAARLHYMSGNFDDAATFQKMAARVAEIDKKFGCGGNVLFYLAVPPVVFAKVADHLANAGMARSTTGWRRLIVEKPFGRDLASARALNVELRKNWKEDQIYRIDHYLGKETVQNLLAFRFSNGMFEPVWNRSHVDHIQFNVAELVGVEGRGGYFDTAGVIRDMVQNHMLQMLAYLMMEPPGSFKAEPILNEKAKVLEAVRVYGPEEVDHNVVRGQYGPGRKPDGSPAVAYRAEASVPKESFTETFLAMRLFIDNWRWDGVPIYLRSGKALWKRGTEIVVQFKKTPEKLFRGTPAADGLGANQLIFHIQPDQGIELRFQAKVPGPVMSLQRVNMRFDYRESFEASRSTGYEVLTYNCMTGDRSNFVRADLVETTWGIMQPLLDRWAQKPPEGYPNYPAGTWGPKIAYDLIEADGRRWQEIMNRSVLERVPLFEGTDDIFLRNIAMMLKSDVYAAGDTIIQQGDKANEMYFIARGRVAVIDEGGKTMRELEDGDFFGETGLLMNEKRSATIKALTNCDVFILSKADFRKMLRENSTLAAKIGEVAKQRYNVEPDALNKK